MRGCAGEYAHAAHRGRPCGRRFPARLLPREPGAPHGRCGVSRPLRRPGARVEAEYSEAEYSEAEYSEAEYIEAEYSEAEYSEAEYSEAEYSEGLKKSIVGHIPLETLPRSHIEHLLASADERPPRGASSAVIKLAGRQSDRSYRSDRIQTPRLCGRVSSVVSSVPSTPVLSLCAGSVILACAWDCSAVRIRPLLWTGMSSCSAPAGGCVFEDTGYVYSTTLDSWQPFGIVPSFVAGAPSGSELDRRSRSTRARRL